MQLSKANSVASSQSAFRPILERSNVTLDALLDILADKIAARIQPERSSRKLLVTLKEAGELIGRSPGAVNQLIKRGELRGVVCGRRIHLQTKEIEEWIERCKC